VVILPHKQNDGEPHSQVGNSTAPGGVGISAPPDLGAPVNGFATKGSKTLRPGVPPVVLLPLTQNNGEPHSQVGNSTAPGGVGISASLDRGAPVKFLQQKEAKIIRPGVLPVVLLPPKQNNGEPHSQVGNSDAPGGVGISASLGRGAPV
jgi:hypothetical protein